jgi:2-polyprenyl-6-methoxyphenol hydroxylase-like FAD-dependent oxidoreductase
VLISGIGIAGPTLAWWLTQAGFDVTLVESAPGSLNDAYMIDFWGAGYDVAERMGLLEELRDRSYRIDEMRFVNARGERIGGVELRSLRSILSGRHFSILRGDLAVALYERVARCVDQSLGESIAAIEQRQDDVFVQFASGRARRFDLVIGADGSHSRVRELAFGAQEAFERRLGYYAAAFFVDRYPFRDERAYVSYTAPRRHLARYALRDGRTAFQFVCVAPSRASDPPGTRAQKNFLRTMFRSNAWEIERILAALDAAEDLYFDRVSQICMPQWSKGRVALVGDACFCPSVLGGQGPSFAMAGAYILARELQRLPGDHASAFRAYEQGFRGFVSGKQAAAQRLGAWFVPRTRLGLAWRNTASALLSNSFVLRQALGKELLDPFELPAFKQTSTPGHG